MGFNFVNRMNEETGASVAEIANCYTVAREVFELSDIWHQIEKLDNKITTAVQTEMLFQLRRTVRRVTRWFLRHRDKNLSIDQSIAFFKASFDVVSSRLEEFMVERKLNNLKKLKTTLSMQAYLTILLSVFHN